MLRWKAELIAQKLEQKRDRGDESPFHMTTNQTYNQESSSYVLDMDRVWVWNIYKKDLVKLGAKIIKSELGGKIGHFSTTEWMFLISRDDYKRIRKEWKKQRLINFTKKLESGAFKRGTE